MLNVIPRYINEKLNANPALREGSITASVMFTDIVAFTAITEKLMKKGKHGAEELSILINKIYNPLIKIVYRNGGYITNFAGDAITVVFPDDNGYRAINAAQSIQENFKKRQNYYRKYSNNMEINVRIGLSFGDVYWMIFGKDRKAYSFYGTPIVQCTEITSGKEPGEIIISKSLISNLRDTNGCIVMKNPVVLSTPLVHIKRSLVKQFVPKAVLQAGYGGEFRNVVSVFIALKWSNDKVEVNNLVNSIISFAIEFGGYFSPIFTADKGPHILVIFGAPVSYENNTDRAVELAYNLKEKFSDCIKAGITSGTVFAGSVGSHKRCTYTVLGDAVNQAARIMQKAEWGQIWVNSGVVDSVSSQFDFQYLGEKQLKGKTNPIKVFNVGLTTDFHTSVQFEDEIVGRKEEIKQLQSFCQPIFNGNFAGITYVYGDAGVGKSRLISEFSNNLHSNAQYFILQTDEILRKSFNPFTYFLKNYFRQTEAAVEENNKIVFEIEWDKLIKQMKTIPNKDRAKPVITELERTKSFISTLLGHDSEKTLHQELNAKGRFENTLFALKEFVKALSLIAPTILVFEDINWLDSDSESVLKTLTQNVTDYPFMIIALSRFRDDGSKPRLILDDEIPVNELVLYPLSDHAEKELMDLRLGGATSPELMAFITDRTGGNPFYIEQFCCYLLENEILEIKSDEYRLIESDFDIPQGIKSILVARIDRLSLKLKELVQKASVLGREFNIHVLSGMLKSENKQIRYLLMEGENETIWSVLTEINFIFKHALLRDVVYGMQLKKQLQQLHGLAAEAMETLYEGDKTHYADIAFHYQQSGIKDKTLSYLKKAADFARDEYRNQEALDLYKRLASITETIEDAIDAELEIANIFVLLGKWDKAENILKKKTQKAVDCNLNGAKARCFIKSAKLFHRKGLNEKAIEYIVKANDFYTEMNDSEGITSTQNLLGNINIVLGKFDEALENFILSNKTAKQIGDLRSIAMNISNMGNIYLYKYDLDKAEEYYKIARIKCDEINEKMTIANTIANMAIVCYYRLEYDKCQNFFDEYISLSEQIGNKEGLAFVYGNIGVLRQELGENDVAMEYYNKQLKLGTELGNLYNISFAKRQIGQLYSISGDFDIALKYLFETLDISKKSSDSKNYCISFENIAEVYYYKGDYEKARENFQMAIGIADEVSEKHVSAYSRLFLSRISARQDNFPIARNYIDEAIAIRREVGDLNELMNSLINSAEVLIIMNNYADAEGMIMEAMDISRTEKIDNNQNKCRLIEALVIADKNTESAVEKLVTLESDVSDEELSARISFELFLLTDSQAYRARAVNLYKKMYNEVQRAEFMEKLQKLDKENK